ncbi:Protein FAR1-like sequence 3 [Apostasia shenzhenica]|uniref:Protein FAR1-like sequence 3 n=1 Tax=Apostasia shenzhenica TaxID=1088818 RepID=A0A2I0A4P1_9ASPA|nr:Protein FAR1-like sequence 3 [Apostasia shenzhenica]
MINGVKNMDVRSLLLHLQKLPPEMSEELLASVLGTLWETRKSGLSPIQKAKIQSAFNLATNEELDPVLSCLRLIIRKVVREKLTEEDLQKLLSLDISVDIRKTLVILLQKYQSLWEEDSARDQHLRHQTRMIFPGRVNTPAACAPLLVSELSSWPRDDSKKVNSNGYGSGHPTQSDADSNLLNSASVPALRDNAFTDDLATLPRLTSMTWTMDGRNSVGGNRIAIITLKLQDYTSPLGEVEVKFQLSRDTLEAMLRSMSHINDQLYYQE